MATLSIENNVPVKCPHCGYGLARVYFTDNQFSPQIVKCQNCWEEIQTHAPRSYNELVNNPYGVTCPFCRSTDCKKISTASKVGKVALFGVFAAGSVSKTWHCNSCGSNFG